MKSLQLISILGYLMAIVGVFTIIANLENIAYGIYDGVIYGAIFVVIGFGSAGYIETISEKKEKDDFEKEKDDLMDKF